MPIICTPTYEESKESAYESHFSKFSFPLSDFQKHAIEAIVEGHHVLVCAPTGSGKTLPAEFAIQYFIEKGKKVIYTSPIKALSNQKYYEFSAKFPGISVGLCTGDIKTNPSADLIIMTAEILNNRLFQLETPTTEEEYKTEFGLSFQMDLQNELAAVVMDEVHYINDVDRGHVWEQTIMTLPPQVQMIMLSATLDGPNKFAEWIESSRSNGEKRVYLAQTLKRIVPLSHYAYFPPAPEYLTKSVKTTPLEPIVKECTDSLITLQTASGVFQPLGYNKMVRISTEWEARSPTGQMPGRKHTLNSLARFMKGSDDPDVDDSMLPAIVFLFSRKLVEECAADMTANILPFDSKIPYNAAHDCEQIIRRLPNWREYVELPEYRTLVKLLEKGVGIHHSGMIPVLREIVELMISQKKIYLLFATESFAIGLDCPIRTAVFTGLSKYDGTYNRYLYAHEYTQMAGRAGRRGIDTVGHVVHLPTLTHGGAAKIPSIQVYADILSGKPQTLVSKFHIDYGMILSLMKKGIYSGFHLFAERSMATSKIQREADAHEQELNSLRKTLAEKQLALNHIRTPLSVCNEYDLLRTSCATAVNKKRKEIERRMVAIKTQYKYLDGDVDLVKRANALELQITQEERTLNDIHSYMQYQTTMVCRVLANESMIYCEGEDWKFTHRGEIASHFAEVHPIPLTHLIIETNWFNGWNTQDLVCLLSVFVDVRVPEHMRTFEPASENERILKAIQLLKNKYEEIGDMERRENMHTGLTYGDGVLCYDLVDAMGIWCGLEDELDCKRFIQGEHIAGLHISAGDFTKACMKVCAIANELGTMAESMMKRGTMIGTILELAHKLREVEKMVLKYVATTQSVYL